MSTQKQHDYHLVDPSPWPLLSSISAFILFLGLAFTLHGKEYGQLVFFGGLGATLYVMYAWWKDVVKEGKLGFHTKTVQHGLRIGMGLFILSELMFFVAFFWAYFKAAIIPVFVFDGMNIFEAVTPLELGVWPPQGIETFNPFDLPFLNTLILLLSGTTVTWAHFAVMHQKNEEVVQALWITVILGVIFTILQAVEYSHAAFCMNGIFREFVSSIGLHVNEAANCEMTSSHIYPSTFFMATGFHGIHVIIGTIFLAVCLVRAKRKSLTKEGHLGFEFAAWYWHFVDVVWLFLFIFIYVWGQ